MNPWTSIVMFAVVWITVSGCGQTPPPGKVENVVESFGRRWSQDLPLFWGFWGKDDQFLCYLDSVSNTLEVLDRKTGARLKSAKIDYVKAHDTRNSPILVADHKAYLFDTDWDDDCQVVDLVTGRVHALASKPLGELRANVSIADGKVVYNDSAAGHSWESPFRTKGFSILSYARAAIGERNIYVVTTIYQGKVKLSDLTPGGYVTGKPVGQSLTVFDKQQGKVIWSLPKEKRLRFCHEAKGVVLVDCTDPYTFRAVDAQSGRRLWEQRIERGQFSGHVGDAFVFLREREARFVKIDSGRECGRLEFSHGVCTQSVGLSMMPPALFWEDGFVVCEDIKDEAGNPKIRVHCYGRLEQRLRAADKVL